MYLKIIKLNEVDSTNSYAYNLAQNGQKEITCVTARAQTKGRGRLDRRWVSALDKGVYASFILRPDVEFRKANLLSIAIALSVVKAMRNILPLKIKWPNDIMFDDKKIGGVLLESQAKAKCPLFIIAGLGVNVNYDIKDIPEGASSLLIETGKKYEIEKIFKSIVQEVIISYRAFQEKHYENIISEARFYMDTLGRNVLVNIGKERIKGTAYRIGKYGALYIKDDEGITRRILSSEVVHCDNTD